MIANVAAARALARDDRIALFHSLLWIANLAPVDLWTGTVYRGVGRCADEPNRGYSGTISRRCAGVQYDPSPLAGRCQVSPRPD